MSKVVKKSLYED